MKKVATPPGVDLTMAPATATGGNGIRGRNVVRAAPAISAAAAPLVAAARPARRRPAAVPSCTAGSRFSMLIA